MSAAPNFHPQSSVCIRLAGTHEAAEIARVLAESFEEFQTQYTWQGFAATTPDEQGVRSRMKEGLAWVAVAEDAIVGTASAAKKLDGALHIRGMAVVPAGRGRRIGEMLLQGIENYAAASGCSRLTLCTTPFLTAAIRLYERFGFRFVADGRNDIFGTPLLNMAKVLTGESEFYEEHRKEQLCRKIMDTLACA
jgi:ribosomal protein S18 acetylase RimI-like enzyme